jgi:predicted kinase
MAEQTSFHRDPFVLVLCGLSGSGKTSLATALAEATGLPALTSDVVRKRLAGLPPQERAGEEHYSEEFSERTYEELGRLAHAAVRDRGGAIGDATFRRARDRAAFARGFGSGAPEPRFARCDAPLGVLRERVRRSTRGASDATVGVLERQRFEELADVPAERRLDLRTDRPASAVLTDLERWLDARLANAAPT